MYATRLAATLRLLLAFVLVALLSACATGSYSFRETESVQINDRAVIQTRDGLTVSASVPSAEEAQALFGIPLYESGVQPVWLEITNHTDHNIRFTPSSLDREYFAPLEVSYVHRGGFSKEARAQMDARLHSSAMPRVIPANETRSGYVFTHLNPGTKSFNVDLFSNTEDATFSFFIKVPGFVPNHSEVNFSELYTETERRDFSINGFKDALKSREWITTSHTGEPGLPVNLVLVGKGEEVLKALLRGGWFEQEALDSQADESQAYHLFGRTPDATFGIRRSQKRERNDLYLWMSPMTLDGEPVWMGRISHLIGQRTAIQQAILGATIDPDIDQGRYYFLQNMWYSQGLEKIAWLAVNPDNSIDDLQLDFNGTEYFTDGYIAVCWLSDTPVSMLKTRRLAWDKAPLSR